MLGAINGGDSRDPGSIDWSFNHDSSEPISGLTLGYLSAAYEGVAVSEVDHATLNAARSLGLSVKEVKLRNLPYDSLVAMIYAEAAASFEDLTLGDQDDTLTRQDDGAWPNAFRKSRFLSAVDHVQLDRLVQPCRQWAHCVDEIDILIGPVSTGPMLIASNFTGHPCLHLRAGFEEVASRQELSLAEGRLELGSASDSVMTFRVPHGVSLCGKLFRETDLLRVGAALEAALGVAGELPQEFAK